MMPLPNQNYTDKTPMPFGRYKGNLMANVPAGYLLTIRDTDWIKDWPDLRDYIDENMDVLERELKVTLERKLKGLD